MNLTAFIADIQKNKLQHPVVSFTGKRYPLLFFSTLVHTAKNEQCDTISLHELPALSALKAQLSMSFLGNQSLYWLGDITTLDARHKKELDEFLHTYTGPHAVWCFTTESVGKSIELPETVSKKEFEQLAQSMQPDVAEKNKLFVTKLFAKTRAVPFEQACLLLRYQQLIGNRADEFMDSWLHEIVVPDQSLFNLSSLFFSRQPAVFMAAWQSIVDDYPAQFWCTFWSEQIFRAYWFCLCMQQKKMAEAKKIGFRLPFSFLQKDWKTLSPQRLLTLHAQLYEIDYALKNGATEDGIFEPILVSFLV